MHKNVASGARLDGLPRPPECIEHSGVVGAEIKLPAHRLALRLVKQEGLEDFDPVLTEIFYAGVVKSRSRWGDTLIKLHDALNRAQPAFRERDPHAVPQAIEVASSISRSPKIDA
ncbi:hypothetical protein FXB41_27975 [Bradyrhizobium canariense]|uniref:hypothetical protein n=1 Tax=Bradyrhizobium canariense TaxID=255045 RepID=UPI001CA4A9B8|nr:hypothetical protein [Bradyrhizobium canariense]MBW5438461.1 hypothetical protein [Bradyrhizobium canariense]